MFNYDYVRKVWNQLPLGNKWLGLSVPSFKGLIRSIFLYHDLEVVTLFSTCAWVIWHVQNKLLYERACFSANMIEYQAMLLSEEYKNLYQQLVSLSGEVSLLRLQRIWKPLNLGILKVSTDVSFSHGKIGIFILVRSHLGIPLLAKALPQVGKFSVDYR